ncbi:hypothetical protein DID88_000001, partial [Monilinia fructigena]
MATLRSITEGSAIATLSLTASADTRKPLSILYSVRSPSAKFHAWPEKPDRPPSRPEEGRKYLNVIMAHPELFENFLTVTQHFTLNARASQTRDRTNSGGPQGAIATQGATLSNWSQDTGMDFIGEVGIPTHRAGHVIDLTFSNIPFAETVVRRDMDCGSDHYTQVTTTPGRGTPPNKRVGYRVTEDGLYTFASLIESGAYWLPKVRHIASDVELETATEQLTDLFQRAIRTAGRPASDRARSAPWWTNESASAYSLYKLSGKTLEDRKRMLSATRKAKREYWRRLIDSASDDADLYKVVGWHRAAPSLKSPPLVVDGQPIEGTREKAQALLDKVLHRYDSTDDLEADPILENRASTLPWDTNVSLEEVERNTIGVSSTSPGADKVT